MAPTYLSNTIAGKGHGVVPDELSLGAADPEPGRAGHGFGDRKGSGAVDHVRSGLGRNGAIGTLYRLAASPVRPILRTTLPDAAGSPAIRF